MRKLGDKRWEGTLRLTGPREKSLIATWRIDLPLDRKLTRQEAAAVPSDPFRALDSGARRLSRLPEPVGERRRRTSSIALPAQVLAVPPGGRSLRVSVVPDYAADPAWATRRGGDDALLRGLALSRGRQIPPLSRIPLAPSATFVQEGDTAAGDRRLDRDRFLRVVQQRPTTLVVLTWRRVGETSVPRLVRRPIAEVRILAR